MSTYKILFRSFLIIILCSVYSLQGFAQLITASPLFPNENDSVTITFDASLGNKGLKDFTGDVYAHTGVITQQSTATNDWKHAPSWGLNDVKYKLTRVSANKYELKIKPSIKEYYGTTANEQVKKLAFVFRSSDNSKEGKTESGGDIFYDVYAEGIFLSFQKPFSRPYYASLNENIPLEIAATKADSIELFVNGQKINVDTGKLFKDTIIATNYGKYWVKAIAHSKTLSAVDSFYFFVKKETIKADLPSGFHNGVNHKNDSVIGFCLTAPGKQSAFIIGDFNNWEPDTIYQMKQTNDGNKFWIEVEKLQANTEYAYQFIVDGKVIADPYAEKVLDPWNDWEINATTYPNLKKYPSGKGNGIISVFTTNPKSYSWKHTDYAIPANGNLTVYELLVRDFSAAHSYQAIIDSLHYLKTLGINALELMPVSEFEGNKSWGYNPSFYFAPDKFYGTPESLKKLIDTCHSIGIVVILDMVLNHSFGQNPMVQLYWDATNNRPAVESPWYNPIAKHDYNVGYDFNHESAFTKEFASDVMKYWLKEYHVDGYRFDLAKGFTQKNTLGNVAAWGAYDATRIAIWKQYSDSIWKTNANAYVILEHFADNSEEKELVDNGMMVWGNANNAYLEAAMGYNEGTKSDFSWAAYKTRGMSKPGLVSYMESHDEERMGFKNITWGNTSNPNYSVKELKNSLQRSELAAALFFTVPGAKMLWQFGELGYDISIDFNGRVGDKPIKWDYFNVPQRKRLYDVYAALINLRKEPAFSSTDYSLNVAQKVKYISINHSDMDVRIVGNFDLFTAEATLNFSKAGWWYDYFTGDSIEVTDLQKSISLDISEYKIFTSKKLSKPQVTTEVKNIKAYNELQVLVYPNPCSDFLHIKAVNSESITYGIADLSGRYVLSGIINGQDALNLSALKQGMYLIRLKQGKQSNEQKLFIVR